MIGNTCIIDKCTKILKKTDGRICQMHRSRKFRHGNYEISPGWKNLKKGQPYFLNGYLWVNSERGEMFQHRYIMENFLGRKLTDKERVHHKNGVKYDNRIENLELIFNQSDHLKKHHSQIWKLRKFCNESVNWTKYSIPNFNTQKRCIVDSCKNNVRSRNLCPRHYQSFYKNWLRKNR